MRILQSKLECDSNNAKGEWSQAVQKDNGQEEKSTTYEAQSISQQTRESKASRIWLESSLAASYSNPKAERDTISGLLSPFFCKVQSANGSLENSVRLEFTRSLARLLEERISSSRFLFHP